MKKKFFKPFYAVFLFTGIMQAQVQVFTVTSDDDDGPGTLRQVIANAAAGDTITFDEKVKHIKLTTGQIEIDKSLTISGNGVGNTKINGNAKGRIFNILSSGDVILEGLLLTNGSANSSGGGAIHVYNTNLTVTDVEISDNEAQYGGGIFINSGTMIMTNCNLINNTANNGGGALAESSSILNITGGNITGNTTTADGGGIYLRNNGWITLDKVTIASNTANRGGGLGTIGGTFTITNSAILGNTAQRGGGLYLGGLFSSDDFDDITTSTLSGNTATNSGGAIFNESALTLTLDASTVVNNLASTNGGGIYNGSGKITLKNTIVAKNNATTGKDVYTLTHPYTSSGHNLIGQDDRAAFTATTGDLVGTATAPIDPKVDPLLTDNGGSTQTHKLLFGSPAYNAGDPLDNFKDQIDQKVFGDPIKRRDIGAYEAQKDLLCNPFFDLKNSNTTVWPNPSNGTIKINLSAGLGNVVLGKLIAIGSGKTVSEFTVNGNSEINLQQYAAGLYIVRLESESITENHKLIIQ